MNYNPRHNSKLKTVSTFINHNNYFLNFLRNIIVVIAVAIIEIILDIIEGNLKPSGACRIYANAIKVHTIAGMNEIM